MPRVSRQQTEANRLAIEAASSRLFRERGIRNVSVADLMGAAGLTHGGFYGHFDSKDALAAVACAGAFEHSAARWKERVARQPDRASAFNAIVAKYLSKAGRDAPGTGCPATALAADVAREAADAPIRSTYLAGLNALLAVLASLHDSGDAATDRDQALAEMATLVGALVLARATQGSALSDQVLEAARRRLTEPTPATAAAATARGNASRSQRALGPRRAV
jgi:TetR/AcrR family transcriptional repressor of nem operon